MKKVVLLGDSIRLVGYGETVAKMLENDGYTVWQPDENSRFAAFTLRQIFNNANEIRGCDVVHFNAGAWDICELFNDGPFTDINSYAETMLRIVKVLKNYYGVKKLIFATTTPVRLESSHNNNEVVKKYNDVIVPILRNEGCEINDLYSIVNPDIYRYVSEDTIHLSIEGIELCSKATYQSIIKALDEM